MEGLAQMLKLKQEMEAEEAKKSSGSKVTEAKEEDEKFKRVKTLIDERKPRTKEILRAFEADLHEVLAKHIDAIHEHDNVFEEETAEIMGRDARPGMAVFAGMTGPSMVKIMESTGARFIIKYIAKLNNNPELQELADMVDGRLRMELTRFNRKPDEE